MMSKKITTEEFIKLQDEVLQCSGKELAELLGCPPSSISGYRNGRPIPEYIAKGIKLRAAIKVGTLKLPLSLEELFAINRAADAAGLTFESYVLKCLRQGLNGFDYSRLGGKENFTARLNQDQPDAAGSSGKLAS